MTQNNPLYDSNLHEAEINPELQKNLNEPPKDPEGISAEEELFLEEVVTKVNSGIINLYVASSLYNDEVVEKLDHEGKARVEIAAQGLLATIRDLISLWEYDKSPSYQLKNLIQKLKVTKERFELAEGDVFLI